MARYEVWVLVPTPKTMEMPKPGNPDKSVTKRVTVQEPRYWKDSENQGEMFNQERLDEAHRLTVKHGGQRFYIRDRSLVGDQSPAGTADEQAEEQAKAKRGER